MGAVADCVDLVDQQGKIRVLHPGCNAPGRAYQRGVLARVDFADRDTAHDLVRVCVLYAGDESAQLLLERHRHGHAGSRAEEHGREVLDLRAGEGADDVFRDEHRGLGAEVVKIAEARAQHELREQPAARHRQHEDLPELRREHAPQRELADGAAEFGVDGCGGTGGIDVVEYAQHQRA